MRKLASIRKIDEVKAHPNADALELAVVGGWQVVVKKGEFLAGDLAVYFEIDSWIPHEIAPFLSKGSNPREFRGVKGERLKTIKLRGEISQGLLLKPLTDSGVRAVISGYVPEYGWGATQAFILGDDVTEFLQVQKWEADIPAHLAGQVEGTFPSFIRKTDQERVQNLKLEVASAYMGAERFEITVKLDGSSMTVFYNNGEVGVCSRNQQLKINDENADNAFVKTAIETNILSAVKEVSENLGRNLAIQGELMGPGVQGNKENFSSLKFFVFDIFDIDKYEYLRPAARYEVLDMLKAAGFTGEHVPVLEAETLLPSSNIQELLEFAEGKSINAAQREGLVFKSTSTDFYLSFKAISNKWLLKLGE